MSFSIAYLMKDTAYLLQAALVCGWWVGLASSRTFFDAFLYEGLSDESLWSFLAPDILLIAALSAFRAYRAIEALEWVILGAFAYATLYCINATLLTGSGFLPTGAMTAGLVYNLLLLFGGSMFRVSTAGRRVNALKTAIQVVCVWSLALGVIPYLILDAFDAARWPSVGLAFWVGVVVFSACSTFGLTSSYFMVRDGEGTPLPVDQTAALVTSGPYAIIRNPMAMAGIGQGFGVGIAFQSITVCLYALLGGLVWQFVLRPLEERDMEERFGEAYVRYRRDVPLWIPRWGGRRESSEKHR